jgi:hypothetical protein
MVGSACFAFCDWDLFQQYAVACSITSRDHMHARIHPFDNYDVWRGSLALMNREPITLRNLLMRTRLQDQKVCVT